jgi:hypothetical protein
MLEVIVIPAKAGIQQKENWIPDSAFFQCSFFKRAGKMASGMTGAY